MEKTCNDFQLERDIRSIDRNRLAAINVDDGRQIIFCTIAKAASSNWKSVFLHTAPKFTEMHQHSDPDDMNVHNAGFMNTYGMRRMHRYSYDEIAYRIKHYYKVILVRDPIKRVISAYRNKVGGRGSIAMRILPDIVANYRQHSSDNVTKITFPEFVQYVIDRPKLKGENALNNHWKAYQDTCFPCTIKYDYVGKLETANTDVNCMLPRISNVSHSFPKPTSYVKGKNVTTWNMIRNLLFKELSLSQLKGLLDVYGIDCTMFGYNCLEV